MISSHIYWRINEAEEWTSSRYYYIGKLNEFGIPPVRGSLLVCNLEESEVRSREIRPPSPSKKRWNFFEDASTPPFRNLVGETRSFRYSTNFIYLFFSSSSSPPLSPPYPQESSPLFILELGARVAQTS